jgi:DNA-binding CsgD family transcriptional regulator
MSFGVAKRVLNYFREEKSEINSHLNDLSKSEHEITRIIGSRFLYKEIADRKDVTIDTIKKHVGNIYRKLHVNNKVEAINILKKHYTKLYIFANENKNYSLRTVAFLQCSLL